MTSSPPASTSFVCIIRCWWVSGTHSSRTIGSNPPISMMRHGDWRW